MCLVLPTLPQEKKIMDLEGQGDYGLIYLATKLTIKLLLLCSKEQGIEMSY